MTPHPKQRSAAVRLQALHPRRLSMKTAAMLQPTRGLRVFLVMMLTQVNLQALRTMRKTTTTVTFRRTKLQRASVPLLSSVSKSVIQCASMLTFQRATDSAPLSTTDSVISGENPMLKESSVIPNSVRFHWTRHQKASVPLLSSMSKSVIQCALMVTFQGATDSVPLSTTNPVISGKDPMLKGSSVMPNSVRFHLSRLQRA